MSNVLTNSASIPYGTWGGVTRSSVTTTVDNPYTISNLQYNCRVNSSIYRENRPVITNMANYAQRNIPGYSSITEIPSGHLPTDINTSLAKGWSNAFGTCLGIRSFPDPFYNTSNAIDMSWMFKMCLNLTTVPNFDTSNVTDMSYMFYSCENLTTVPNFDTSNVIDMSYMFDYCTNLTTIPNFNTSKVTYMGAMFWDCSNIKGNLYIESNNVRYAGDLFHNTPKYTKNIYCHANTTTYNSIYKAMGNNTYNYGWNAYLKTF